MERKITHDIRSVNDFHKAAGLEAPHHPLVSLVDYSKVQYQTTTNKVCWVQNFYSIGLKRNLEEKFGYGQQEYDFDQGLMSFIAPSQVVSFEVIEGAEQHKSGWILCIHPDFIWNTPLAKNIKRYDFFGYAINEALFLSKREEDLIINIMQNIEQEYNSSIDTFTQNIIIAQLEVLLNYSERFYQRQFITRNKNSQQILIKLDEVLSAYFNNESLLESGLPSVKFIAAQLNSSPNYLSSLLKTLTGQNTRQHIQNKVIERAKEKLSTTDDTISEIAYELGFKHSQSFSKLFMSKTKQSPSEFRASFN
ncbi:helix-turn-helix domain-containing protein [Leeuwenhoekiella polynyae]|uniref:Helix-turn-helix protein n=1 Tax=Leeuwenhoekiella polynyae TaxID=1550906 RepID=A0A4Q0PHC3_9FLAO|nr:helix-turn-helix transcriptional regulator [Leeuwenhoekiella polynyae]RXG26283.1 helix-turn-helix protein [Leeuwenhoekiella polynyae]